MNLEKSTLIYKISNLINGKIYIGQTLHSLKVRYPKHFSRKPSNNHLKSAYKKYGSENFRCDILQLCTDIHSLNYWEKYYIGLYNSSDPKFGYNKTSGGENFVPSQANCNLRSKLAKEYIEKNPQAIIELKQRSEVYWTSLENRARKSEQMKVLCASKERRLLMATVQGSEPFKVFTKTDNQYVGTWVNKAECARELSIDSRKICACLSGSRKSHKGYVFVTL